ncbi:hypothetical protein M6D93_15575 [Jatrophihabitans telluris]|uniref:Heavy metal transporter n=1 Tax=Jatrophihabitans telluris TaxID=2038343 RepID=A0ABY4QVW8_9ACTN|nr:hypothetical protein [Jatrophihabitans telluris]UQX87710.1 hypothetical protein M6D93_15575 [Jatrophihabitans telluris]
MSPGAGRRGAVALAVIVVVIGGLALGARTLWHAAQTAVQPSGCDFGAYHVELSRSENAAQMVSVVLRRGLPERAAVLSLGAALQESKLDNIPSGQGDRDSVGILQQRPSQGWGTAQNLSDVRYATGKFLDALVKIDGWKTDSLAVVVQKVQVSADGSAYAKHEQQAQVMADALTGKAPAAVTCDFDKPTKVAAMATVVAQLKAELPVAAPAASGTTITVPGASWATAAWLVTHADRYGIAEVRCKGQRWQRSGGWKADGSASSAGVVATMATV